MLEEHHAPTPAHEIEVVILQKQPDQNNHVDVMETTHLSASDHGGGGGIEGGQTPTSSSKSRRNSSRRGGFLIQVPKKMGRKVVGLIFRAPPSKKIAEGVMTSNGMGEASIYHALVVIFLEFFAWGLLTSPMITVLNQTFPEHTFLMNGIIMGIKGFLSFLSAPLVGALSDIWGRKFFLLITVFFTCAPIPLMKVHSHLLLKFVQGKIEHSDYEQIYKKNMTLF
jgi:hypothetical protein